MAAAVIDPASAAGGAEGAAIRLVIVDDHPVVRDGTAALLDQQAGFRVVATAGSLEAAAEVLARVEADVVLLDIRLGSDSGLRLLAGGPDAQATAGAKAEAVAGAQAVVAGRRRPAIVVLTAYDYPQYAEAALRLGAAGFVLKTAPLAELLDAIRRAAAGGMAFSVHPGGRAATRLSPRELDVVRLVVDGFTNDEIGARLGIGGKTVETHLGRLFERFAVASRTELATRALREGWLEIPPSR